MIQRRLAALMLSRAAFPRLGQTVEMPVLLPEKRLKVGLEVQYRGGGETTRENGTMKGFGLGPTLSGHFLTKVHFDLSPLFGWSVHIPTSKSSPPFRCRSADPKPATPKNQPRRIDSHSFARKRIGQQRSGLFAFDCKAKGGEKLQGFCSATVFHL